MIFNGLDVGVARGAFLHVEREGVRVVAAVAGVVRRGVLELAVVQLAVIFVAALRQGAVLRGRGREVMHVAEAEGRGDGLAGRVLGHQRLHDGVFIRRLELEGVGDLLVHAELGLAALVAFHTAGLVAQARQLEAGREDDAVLGDGAGVVARDAVNHRVDGVCLVDLAGRAAVDAQEVLVAAGAVALGAGSGHFLRIILIPVAERLGFRVGVAGALPFLQARHGRGGGIDDRSGLRRRRGGGGSLRCGCSGDLDRGEQGKQQHDRQYDP